MPRASDSSYYRQPQLQAPVPYAPAPPRQRVRLDRIASQPGHDLQGQLVAAGRPPLPGTRILFVNADQSGARQTAATDERGQFRVSLASGSWLIYVQDAQGNSVFHRKVEVGGSRPHQITLVSR